MVRRLVGIAPAAKGAGLEGECDDCEQHRVSLGENISHAQAAGRVPLCLQAGRLTRTGVPDLAVVH
jgi:hypothetical protein